MLSSWCWKSNKSKQPKYIRHYQLASSSYNYLPLRIVWPTYAMTWGYKYQWWSWSYQHNLTLLEDKSLLELDYKNNQSPAILYNSSDTLLPIQNLASVEIGWSNKSSSLSKHMTMTVITVSPLSLVNVIHTLLVPFASPHLSFQTSWSRLYESSISILRPIQFQHK